MNNILLQKNRSASIDVLRGLVMLLMLVDHVCHGLYVHMPTPDPMDVTILAPALFFTRLSSHLCAPIFIFLAGISAWIYAHRDSTTRVDASVLLLGTL